MIKRRRFCPKPWWNRIFSEAWRQRERCYRTFKTTGNIEDRIKWKMARANATRTFREGKKKDWHSYVDTLSINTKASLVWKKIKSISGRPPSKVNMLKGNDIFYTSIEEITERLAQTFQEIISNLNYDPQFLLYKEASEQEQFNFESNKCEKYNEPFTIEELHRAIKASKNNSPGPDER